MTAHESVIQAEIRMALSDLGLVFWRNNVGAAQDPATGRVHAYGLAVGSADLIGIVDGRFCALEVKSATGRTTEHQDRWLALVRRAGGFACVVRSAADAIAAVARCRAGGVE